MRQIAENTEPIVDGNDNEAVGRELGSVVEGLFARSGLQSTAVNPDQDRRTGRGSGRPNIEC
jgi:hypothetical protein